HSLDDAEIETWLDRVQVGNGYVNRHTTGAIVRRQPFGGWKRSAVGRGAKTGGPGDILRFVRFRRDSPPPTLAAATASYRRWWDEQFGIPIDRSGLRSEANVLRYRPVGHVVVRTGHETPRLDVESLRAAAGIAGVAVDVAGPEEDDTALVARLSGSGAERLRLLVPCDDELRRTAHASGITVDETAVTHDGRVELPCWLREQAISRTMHRHGRIPQEAQEIRHG
ncbi:MAG: aldehyde dehydrogenase family protein, partial [Ilumatobacteraceae bacterium]